MTEAATRSVVIERELRHPPEKVWRALTEPHRLAEWLMAGDVAPAVGHRFALRADWGSVDCRVLAVEPCRSLSYTWTALGLDSVVTWTLTPTPAGTRLRLEQAGFRPDQQQAHRGAEYGWPRFLAALDALLARLA